MFNKLMARLSGEVKVVYREHEVVMDAQVLKARVNENGIGKILGTEADYNISAIDLETNVVEITRTDMIIDKASIVDALVDKIQKKGKGMSHIQVILNSIKEYDDEGNVIKEIMKNHTGFIRLPENLSVRLNVFKMEENCKLRDGKNIVTVTKDDPNPATKQIMSVKCGQDEKQGELIYKYGLFSKDDKFGGYTFWKQQGAWLINLETGEKVRKSDVVADPNNASSGLVKGWRNYRPFGASPSNERQNTIYLIDCSNSMNIEAAHNALSELTYGAYDVRLINEEVGFDKLAKASTRWFQWMAPSSCLGHLENYAIYFGKFNEDRADGLALVASEALARMIKKKHGLKIDPVALQGLFMQTRVTQSKVGSMPIKERMMERIVEHLDPNPIRFTWDEVEQLGISLKERAEAGEFNGRVVVFGNGPVEALYDMNGMKSIYDFSKAIRPEFSLLRILRSNGSNFSKNIFEKMLAKNKEKAMDVAEAIVSKNIMDRMERQFLNPQPQVVSPDEFTKESWYMDQIIGSVFPSYLSNDKNLAMNVLGNITDSVNKVLGKFKAPMEGRNAGIIVGIESFFGLDSFIGDNEVICPAANKMFKKEGMDEEDWRIFTIKYPSMDLDEYSTPLSKTLKAIKPRIKASGVDKELQDLFVDFYATLHDSVMVVPACELYKKLHAGSDFDTDQVSWSMLKEIVETMHVEKKVAIDIE